MEIGNLLCEGCQQNVGGHASSSTAVGEAESIKVCHLWQQDDTEAACLPGATKRLGGDKEALA